MKNIISVKNLSRTYEYTKRAPGFHAALKSFFVREKLYKHAIDDINFDVAEGELIGFLGPNGAGKTTTLKILSGILYPTSGEARVLGYLPHERNHEMQKQFALVMGNKNQLWWDLPSTDTFLLNKEIYGLSDAVYTRNLHELVEMLDIKDVIDVPVRKLSLGQRMKCELVASLLHNPKVLLLDEPTLGLDVVAQKNIREFIKKYNQEKKTTILLTSHYMDDIRELAKRVIIIHTGKIVFDGDLESLITKFAPYKLLKVKFLTMPSKEEVGKYGHIEESDDVSFTLKAPRAAAKHIASKLLASDLEIEDIDITEPEVENVIREVFQKGKA